MNITDAAHQTVHAYPGGSEALGPRIDMSAAVLRSKVNPNNATHHLTLAEASEIMSVTGDHRMLHALAGEHGYVLQKLGADGGTAERNVVDLLLGKSARDGAFAQAIQDALADGVITPNEQRQIEEAGYCMQRAVMVLLTKLTSISGQRAPVRA